MILCRSFAISRHAKSHSILTWTSFLSFWPIPIGGSSSAACPLKAPTLVYHLFGSFLGRVWEISKSAAPVSDALRAFDSLCRWLQTWPFMAAAVDVQGSTRTGGTSSATQHMHSITQPRDQRPETEKRRKEAAEIEEPDELDALLLIWFKHLAGHSFGLHVVCRSRKRQLASAPHKINLFALRHRLVLQSTALQNCTSGCTWLDRQHLACEELYAHWLCHWHWLALALRAVDLWAILMLLQVMFMSANTLNSSTALPCLGI
jgi:hypothetical protein